MYFTPCSNFRRYISPRPPLNQVHEEPIEALKRYDSGKEHDEMDNPDPIRGQKLR